jgi:hypothetical protein
MKTVGIIGGSGFIGSHITQQFLSHGYEVKVSSTNLSNKEKYAHLEKMDHSDHLSVSQLDVANKEQLESFVKDCDIVIHSGTPFQLDMEDVQRDLLDPTIKGTENFLAVIRNAPKVKKAVLVASVAAYNTNFPLPAGGKTAADPVNENDTPFMSAESHPYAQAKFIANQTVNDFIAKHPDLDTQIVTVSPVGVMGKSLSNREDSTSTGLQFLFKNKIAPNPFIQMCYDLDVEFAIVNVKDVARGVYKAGTIDGLHGKNYLLTSESYSVSDINLMLNEKNPVNQAKVIYENKLAHLDLGMQFQSAQETFQQYNSQL